MGFRGSGHRDDIDADGGGRDEREWQMVAMKEGGVVTVAEKMATTTIAVAGRVTEAVVGLAGFEVIKGGCGNSDGTGKGEFGGGSNSNGDTGASVFEGGIVMAVAVRVATTTEKMAMELICRVTRSTGSGEDDVRQNGM